MDITSVMQVCMAVFVFGQFVKKNPLPNAAGEILFR